jgi:hypothetical protein
VAKPAKTDRQAVIEQMRKKQKSAERRRGTIIVTVCVLAALAIVGAAAVPILKDKWDQRQYNGKALADIGQPASTCQKITTKKADGNQQHVPEGTPVTYTTAPPAFGAHWNVAGLAPAPFARHFYTAEDRPELESLVHNLEHGYTILWYDDTIAGDEKAMEEIQGIADKFGDQNFRDKFIAAPWTKDTENYKPFPDGTHVAFTHWSAGGNGVTDTSKQVGVFQYCDGVSGEALSDFMAKYPYTDSPEPNAM